MKKKSIGKTNPMFFKLILVVVILGTLMGVMGIIRHFTYKEPKQYVTVTFDTDGGVPLEICRVVRGQPLSAEPYAEKTGFAFAGWYKNKELTERFYRNSPIEENITLYASFVDPKVQSEVFLPDSAYLPDCPKDYNIEIVTNRHITQSNYTDFIKVEAIFGSLPEFKLISGGSGYYIIPDGQFMPGGLYRVRLLDENVRFAGLDKDVTEINIRIKTDEAYNNTAVTNNRIRYISTHEISDKIDDYHFVLSNSVVDSSRITVGSVLCIGNGSEIFDGEEFFVRVSDISRQSNASFITAVDCGVLDLMSSFNMHFSKTLTVKDFLLGINPARIASEVRDSEFSEELSEILSDAIDSVADNVPPSPRPDNSLSSGASASEGKTIEAASLLGGLKVSAKIGEASNKNFPNPDDEYIALTLTFDYSAELRNGKKAKADITLVFYMSAKLHGTSVNADEKHLIDYGADIYMQTDADIKVTVDGEDITNEICGIIAGKLESNESAVTELIKDSLGGNGQRELCRVPLVAGRVHTNGHFPVFYADFDIAYTLSINLGDIFKTDTRLSTLNAVEVGVVGNTDLGSLRTYTFPITRGSGASDTFVDSFIGGRLEMFSGVTAKLSIGSDMLRSLGSIGLQVKAGCLTDIRGYSHMIALPEGDLSQDGAAYFENAKYVSLNAVVDSEYFMNSNDDKRYGSQSHETPTFTVGERYMLLGLIHKGKTYFVNGERAEVPLFSGRYLDLYSGKECFGAFTEYENLSVAFSDPLFSYDTESGNVIFDRAGADYRDETLVCDIDAYYIGSNAILHKGIVPVTVSPDAKPKRKYTNPEKIAKICDDRHERLTLVGFLQSSDASEYGTPCQVQFWLDCNGEKKLLGTRTVLSGEVAGAFRTLSLCELYSAAGKWDKDPSVTEVTGNMSFTFSAEQKQTVVGFIYYNGYEWIGVTQPTVCGSMTRVPTGSEKSFDGLKFSYWKQYTNFNSTTGEFIPMSGLSPVNFGKLGKTLAYENHRILPSTFDFKPTTVTGTLGGVTSAIFDSAVNSGFACYVAEYNSNKRAVEFIYTNDDFEVSSQHYLLDIGSDPTIYAKSSDNAYSKFVGWDATGDGIADYFKGDALPLVSENAVYRAIYSYDDVTVYIYNYSANGTYVDKTAYTVASGTHAIEILTGNAPSIKDLSASNEDRFEFMYWECSWDDRIWHNADSIAGYRIYSSMYLRPVFRKHINLTLDAGDGSWDGEKTLTKSIIAGQEYSISKLDVDIPKIAQDKYYAYSLLGWKDTETNTILKHYEIFSLSKSTRLVAVYTREDRKYSLKVTTEHGVIYGSDKTDLTFTLSYDESLPIKTVYTTNLPADVNDGTFFWHCLGSKVLEIDGGRGIEITYDWEKKIAVTLEANGGKFEDGSSEKVIYIDEGEVLALETVIPPTEDSDRRFICWQDQSGIRYHPMDVLTPRSNIILTAEREAEGETVYTITFDAGENALFANGTRYFTICGREGEYVGRYPLCPATDVYDDGLSLWRFNGWDTDVPVTFTSDLTISATWEVSETENDT